MREEEARAAFLTRAEGLRGVTPAPAPFAYVRDREALLRAIEEAPDGAVVVELVQDAEGYPHHVHYHVEYPHPSRPLGMGRARCFDGDCIPWTKFVCRSCGIRPMKVYSGETRAIRHRDMLWREGLGVMTTKKARCPGPYWALDNGAFSCYRRGVPFDEGAFLDTLAWHRERPHPAPDFLVVPDIVAGGAESLAFSLAWLDRLPRGWTRLYLAVQDGMEREEVEAVLDRFDGIFVGGTRDWKRATAADWVALAHAHGLPCHVARVYQGHDVQWALSIGADSIDSTGWARRDAFHHLGIEAPADRDAGEAKGPDVTHLVPSAPAPRQGRRERMPPKYEPHGVTVITRDGAQYSASFPNETAALDFVKDRIRYPDVTGCLVSKDWTRPGPEPAAPRTGEELLDEEEEPVGDAEG